MGRLLLQWIIGAVFIYLLSIFFSGVIVESAMAAFLASVILGFINMSIKPILVLITLPISFLTLGIFYLVINAFMLIIVSAIVPGFYVSSFWTAFFASILLSVFNIAFGIKDIKAES